MEREMKLYYFFLAVIGVLVGFFVFDALSLSPNTFMAVLEPAATEAGGFSSFQSAFYFVYAFFLVLAVTLLILWKRKNGRRRGPN